MCSVCLSTVGGGGPMQFQILPPDVICQVHWGGSPNPRSRWGGGVPNPRSRWGRGPLTQGPGGGHGGRLLHMGVPPTPKKTLEKNLKIFFLELVLAKKFAHD